MSHSFNLDRQHTLAAAGMLSGSGLHTGVPVSLTLAPAPVDFGVQFQRVDLPGSSLIKADCDLVTDTFRKTTLSNGSAEVSAVEHILAALAGIGVDNCLIKVNAREMPSIDGSCLVFVELIRKVGIVEQNAPKIWYTLDGPVRFEDHERNTAIEAVPDTEYCVSTYIDFRNLLLGSQSAIMRGIHGFVREIAPCRTFCFVHELDMLMKSKLIQGDIVNNAILIVDQPVSEASLGQLAKKLGVDKLSIRQNKYLDNLELRFENEIARHKLLDMVGDLSLIGFPIKAHFKGFRQGHSTNNAMARKVKALIKSRKLQPQALL